MSFLQRSSRLATLPWSHLSPITRPNVPRVNLQGGKLQRQFTGGSMACNGLARPRLGGLQPSRSTRTLHRDYKFTPPRHHPPPSMPHSRSPLSGTVVVGGIVVSCILATGWLEYMESELKTNSAQARKWASEFSKNWVLSLRNIDEQRWHTIITSTFIHAGLLHLSFNMLTLWSFGQPVALRFGAPRFLLLYFGSGIAGAMLQIWYWKRNEPRHSKTSAVGASGCITGLLGVMTILAPGSSVSIMGLRMKMWQSSLLAVVLSLAAIQTDTLPWIGHVDHLGGMAFGAVFYALALRRGRAPRSGKMY